MAADHVDGSAAARHSGAGRGTGPMTLRAALSESRDSDCRAGDVFTATGGRDGRRRPQGWRRIHGRVPVQGRHHRGSTRVSTCHCHRDHHSDAGVTIMMP